MNLKEEILEMAGILEEDGSKEYVYDRYKEKVDVYKTVGKTRLIGDEFFFNKPTWKDLEGIIYNSDVSPKTKSSKRVVYNFDDWGENVNASMVVSLKEQGEYITTNAKGKKNTINVKDISSMFTTMQGPKNGIAGFIFETVSGKVIVL